MTPDIGMRIYISAEEINSLKSGNVPVSLLKKLSERDTNPKRVKVSFSRFYSDVLMQLIGEKRDNTIQWISIVDKEGKRYYTEKTHLMIAERMYLVHWAEGSRNNNDKHIAIVHLEADGKFTCMRMFHAERRYDNVFELNKEEIDEIMEDN